MEVQILICIVIYIVMGQKAMIFPQQRNKGAVMANINLLPQLANKIYDESIRYSFTIAAIISEKYQQYIIDIPTNQAQCPNQV